MNQVLRISLAVLLLAAPVAAPAAFAEGSSVGAYYSVGTHRINGYWVFGEPRPATSPVTGQGAEPVYDVLKGPGFAATGADVLRAAMQTVGGGA